MDNPVPTPEELAAEQAAAKVPTEEELRPSIIEEFGFDPDTDGEKIDKATKKEHEHRTKLSGAIGQKIKYRTAAEEAAKKAPPEKKPADGEGAAPKPADLSGLDILAITRAQVHDDDIDTVMEFAKFKKISVADALKDPTVKSILATKAEERTTAEATQARPGARGSGEVSGEDILAKAKATGEVPDDDAGMQKLFLARQALKGGKKR